MTPAGQALHVLRKDVRAAGWGLLLWAALLVVALFAALRQAGSGPEMLLSLLVVFVPMLLLGILVQADSPARPDAFWVTRPLSASAVCGAKLAAAVLLLIVPALLAQAVAGWAHDAPASAVWRILAEGAGTLVFWLGVAAAVAAVTKDLRVFLLGLGLVVVLTQTLMTFVLMPASMGGAPLIPLPRLPGWLAWLIAAAPIGLVIWQYLARGTRRSVTALAGLALCSVAVAAGVPRTALPAESPPPAVTGALQQLDGIVPAQPGSSGNRLTATVMANLPVPAGDSVRLTVVPAAALLRLADGTEEPLDGMITHEFSFGTFSLFYDSGADRAGRRPVASVHMMPRQFARLQEPGSLLIVTGHVHVSRLEHAGELPLQAGARLTRNGRRIRIVRTVTGEELGVDISISEIGPGAVGFRSGRLRDGIALQVMGPEPADTATLMFRETSGSAGGLVLPAPSSWSTAGRLGTWPPRPGQELRTAWPAGARLRVGVWRDYERYPVRIVARPAGG